MVAHDAFCILIISKSGSGFPEKLMSSAGKDTLTKWVQNLATKAIHVYHNHYSDCHFCLSKVRFLH